MSFCVYNPIGFIDNTSRYKYESDCGMVVIQIDHEVWDSEKGYIRSPIKGNCMKCGREILVSQSSITQGGIK